MLHPLFACQKTLIFKSVKIDPAIWGWCDAFIGYRNLGLNLPPILVIYIITNTDQSVIPDSVVKKWGPHARYIVKI